MFTCPVTDISTGGICKSTHTYTCKDREPEKLCRNIYIKFHSYAYVFLYTHTQICGNPELLEFWEKHDHQIH